MATPGTLRLSGSTRGLTVLGVMCRRHWNLGPKRKAAALAVFRDLVIAAVVVVLIWLGLRLLRSETALSGLGPFVGKLIQALVAIVLGVVGIWALFIVVNSLVEHLPAKATTALRPFVFVLPAIAVVSLYLVFPAVGTIIQSFTEVPEGEGLLFNYGQAFSDPKLQLALRNNAIWLVLAPAGALLIGLTFARPGRPDQTRGPGQDLHIPPPLHLGGGSRGHLAVRVRMAAPRHASDRRPQCHRHFVRVESRFHGCKRSPPTRWP